MAAKDEAGGQSHLTGNFRVRAVRPALAACRRLLPRAGDRIEVRSHALKLRYWPSKRPMTDSGKLLDVDWSWIKALRSLDIGELRIEDNIGGCDNLRIIFFVGDRKVHQPLPIIWVLHVMQKKRMEFTANDLAVFKARRALVVSWFYTR